jgi:hypothetical protein
VDKQHSRTRRIANDWSFREIRTPRLIDVEDDERPP